MRKLLFYLLTPVIFFSCKANEDRSYSPPKFKEIRDVSYTKINTEILQEYINICPAEDGNTLIKGLKEFLNYYNNLRTHPSLDRKTPYDWYEYAA